MKAFFKIFQEHLRPKQPSTAFESGGRVLFFVSLGRGWRSGSGLTFLSFWQVPKQLSTLFERLMPDILRFNCVHWG